MTARKQISMSAAQYRALKPRAPSKYRAVRTKVDGIWFDSKAEAAHYAVLIQHRSRTRITDLRIHPRFPLHVNGVMLGHYEADFSFTDNNGGKRVQDVKGVMTRHAKWKIAHFEAEYGVDVEIIRGPAAKQRRK